MSDGGEFVLVAQRVKFSRISPIPVIRFKEIHCKIVHSLFLYSMHLATNYMKMHYKIIVFHPLLATMRKKMMVKNHSTFY